MPLPPSPPREAVPGVERTAGRDGTATWTDPAGRTRTTAALDALDALVLVPVAGGSGAPHTGGPAESGETGATVDADPAPWSALETRVHLLLEHRPLHRRCTTASALRAARPRHRVVTAAYGPPPF